MTNDIFNKIPVCIAVKRKTDGKYELIKANKIYAEVLKNAGDEISRIDRKTDKEAVRYGSSSATIEVNGKFYLISKTFRKSEKLIIITITDITSIKRDNIRKVKIDPLTKTIRREYGLKLLDSAMLKLRDYNTPFSLMAVDFDDFKLINDRFGHQCGDKVLSYTCNVIRQSLRKVDIITRYGGDEFLIILPFTSKAACRMVAERIRKNVEANKIKCDKGYANVTVSIGMVFVNDRNLKLKDIIERADGKLYEAKNKGKNKIEF